MLLIGSHLISMPVMSLQTGQELASIKTAVINPKNLTISAYELDGPALDQKPSLLRIADIREISDIGMIVDSSDEFITPDDVVSIKEIYEYHFDLIQYKVIDTKKRTLGKVAHYSIEPKGFVIQQLGVKRPLLHSLKDTELLIHRSQIKEINDDVIIVYSDKEKSIQPLKQVARSYSNPFRSQSPQTRNSAKQ